MPGFSDSTVIFEPFHTSWWEVLQCCQLNLRYPYETIILSDRDEACGWQAQLFFLLPAIAGR